MSESKKKESYDCSSWKSVSTRKTPEGVVTELVSTNTALSPGIPSSSSMLSSGSESISSESTSTESSGVTTCAETLLQKCAVINTRNTYLINFKTISDQGCW